MNNSNNLHNCGSKNSFIHSLKLRYTGGSQITGKLIEVSSKSALRAGGKVPDPDQEVKDITLGQAVPQLFLEQGGFRQARRCASWVGI